MTQKNNILKLHKYTFFIPSSPYSLPSNHILIYFDKYTDKEKKLKTPQEKLSFLYTYIFEFDAGTAINYITKLIKWLKEDGIPFIIEDYPLYYPSENYFYYKNKFIDPQSIDIKILIKLFKDKTTLYTFLFSYSSYIALN